MNDNLKEKVNAIGERLKIGGVEVGRKMSASMSSVSFKVKEFFQEPNQADKLVGEATSEALDEPNWAIILHICDLVNGENLNTCDVIRAIKKRVMMKSHREQYLALVLLEALAKNCDKGFFEVVAERVLEEMVKLIDDPMSVVINRDKALVMVETWGESTTQLRYLPAYEQTYKILKSRGIRFPNRHNESFPPPSTSTPLADRYLIQQDIPADVNLAHLIRFKNHVPGFTLEQTKEAFEVARNSIELLSVLLSSSLHQDVLKEDLTITLVQQSHESQSIIHRIIETIGDNEALLFEALNVNDEIYKVLSKYEELKKPIISLSPLESQPSIELDESPHFKEDALIRRKSTSSRVGISNDDMMDDLDEMIFGKKNGDTSEWRHDSKKQQSSKDDIMSF